MTQSFRKDVEEILSCLPAKKQILACSATFDEELDQILTAFMNHPIGVTPKKEAPILIGVKQFGYEMTPSDSLNSSQDMQNKINAIQLIFSKISFKQCLIFSNSQSRAESYCNFLERNGWPTKVITGTMEQKERLAVFRDFRNFRCRILIATDLMARGVDSENVNLVINLEVPSNPSVYLHRIGRCGRFGSHGIAITLLSTDAELFKFRKMLVEIGGPSMTVLRFQPSVPHDIWDFSKRTEEIELYGGISGSSPCKLEDDDHYCEEQINDVQTELDLVHQNLALLEISKLLADQSESTNEQTCDDLFENYSMDVNQSRLSEESSCKPTNFENVFPTKITTDDSNTAFLDAIARLDLYPTQTEKSSIPKSISVLETNGSASEPESSHNENFVDSSDDENEPIFLELGSDQSSTPSSCYEKSSDEVSSGDESDIDESSCDSEPMQKTNSRDPQKIWEQMYWKQVTQLQNYLKMSRNVNGRNNQLTEN